MPPSFIDAPLAVADDLRVDVDGVPALDGLAFRTTGRRVLVLGAPRALFDAATGITPIVRGSLSIRGASPAEAAARGVIAGAAVDPPTPPRWTVAEYVAWSARLAGMPRTEARASAAAALEKLQLGPMAKTPMAGLVAHARRATVVAAALATAPEVIAIEDPIGGLLDEVASAFAKVLEAALSDRAWVIFAPRISLTSPLALAADEAIVMTAAQVEARGAPAEIAAQSRRFVLRLHGELDAIEPSLVRRGARVERSGAQILLDLGAEMTTSELMAICAGAGVAIVELLPVSRALG